MTKRWLLYGSVIIFLILVIKVTSDLGQFLVKKDVPYQSDAIVILMGSFPERVLEASDLYRDGIANQIIIVEEYMGPYRVLEDKGIDILSNSKQALKSLIALGVDQDSIKILAGDARSTLDEAIAVRDYLKFKPSVDTLILVSSPAHMRRSYMIFSAALRNSPQKIFVGCSPSRYSDFNPGKWWRRKEDVQSVLSEYVKIISFVLFEHRQLK